MAIYELAHQAQQGEDHRLKAMMTVVKPPALALYFMTANRNAHPQATFDQTMAAYAEQRQDYEAEDGHVSLKAGAGNPPPLCYYPAA